jgi:hypothetical protein
VTLLLRPLLLLLLSPQLTALPQLLQWLSEQNSDRSNELLHGRLDMSRVAVAGHSRGGKLAALQYAQGGAGRYITCYNFDQAAQLTASGLAQCLLLSSGHSRGGKLAALQYAQGKPSCYVTCYKPKATHATYMLLYLHLLSLCAW